MMRRHWTNLLSRLIGRLAELHLPLPTQHFVNRTYVRLVNADLRDFEDIRSYPSLNALFTRALVKPRNFDSDPDRIISPADSRITAQGKLQGKTVLQIKGMPYSVDELVTSAAAYAERMIDGDYINFYLAPNDYHRYHAVTDFRLTRLIHVPGCLYPVNTRSLQKRKDLFIRNERVVLECLHPSGRAFYLVFVGATNVGKIVFPFEERLQTNTDSIEPKVYEYEDCRKKKGECLGWFAMGSSIVLLAEKDFLQLQTKLNEKVRFGDAIATVKRSER